MEYQDSDGLRCIRYDHPKQIQHRHPYLPDGYISIGIFGSSGSGKSTYVLKILPNISPMIKHVVIFTFIVDNPVNLQIEKWVKTQPGMTFTMCYSSPRALWIRDKILESKMDRAKPRAKNEPIHMPYYDPNRIEESEKKLAGRMKVKNTKKKVDSDNTYDKPDAIRHDAEKNIDYRNGDVLFIFDDFQNYKSSKDEAINNFLVKCTSQFRNYGGHFISITQQYNDWVSGVRNNFKHRVMFRHTSRAGNMMLKSELKGEFEDIDQHYGEILKRLNSVPFLHATIRSSPAEIQFSNERTPFLVSSHQPKTNVKTVSPNRPINNTTTYTLSGYTSDSDSDSDSDDDITPNRRMISGVSQKIMSPEYKVDSQNDPHLEAEVAGMGEYARSRQMHALIDRINRGDNYLYPDLRVYLDAMRKRGIPISNINSILNKRGIQKRYPY